jgi:hypothetical protein
MCRCRPLCHRLGALPVRGCPDPDEIWSVGFAAAALSLLWSELRVEEVTTTPSNKFFAAYCFLAPVVPVFPLRSSASLGGEGTSGRSWVSGGSGGSRSSASSVRVCGAGGAPAVSAPPSSPLSAGLDGEGRGSSGLVRRQLRLLLQARSPLLLLPCGSSCPPGRPWRRGGGLELALVGAG